MRYSRFRASVLGIEPKRRNRNPKDSNKSKVTKSQKETKTVAAKKEKDEEATVKPDPGAVPQATAASGTIKIKNEAGSVKKEAIQNKLNNFNNFRFPTPADMSPLATTLPDTAAHLPLARLLTPGSDSNELFAPTHGGSGAFIAAASPIPANDALLHQHHLHNTVFGYTPAGQQESPSPWHPTSPSYSPFQLPPYEMDNFNSAAAAGYCDHTSQQQQQHHYHHHHNHHHHPSHVFGIAPSATMAPDHTHAPVKHEEWDFP